MSAFVDRLRAFELRCQAALSEIKCPVHLCLGQEQVPDELHDNLRPEDWLFSHHRNHGHYLAKGGSEQALWDEIMGLETGVNRGFSGSMSISEPALRFHATAVVGGLIGAAVGAALALKLSGDPGIVVSCIGDAATEQGVFWEGLNFAVLKGLPILWICENNSWSVHTHVSERQARPIGKRVAAFGVVVWGSVAEGFKATREGRLPGYVEVACERLCRHVNNMDDFREDVRRGD